MENLKPVTKGEFPKIFKSCSTLFLLPYINEVLPTLAGESIITKS